MPAFAVPEAMLGWFQSELCTINLSPARTLDHFFIGPDRIEILSEDGVLSEFEAAWEVTSVDGHPLLSASVPVATAAWMEDGFIVVDPREHPEHLDVVTLHTRITVQEELWQYHSPMAVMVSSAPAERRGAHSIGGHGHCLAYKAEGSHARFDEQAENARSEERCKLATQCCKAERERGTAGDRFAHDRLCAADPELTPRACAHWVAALHREYSELEKARRCALSRGPEAEQCSQRFTSFGIPRKLADGTTVVKLETRVRIPKRAFELPRACMEAYEAQALPSGTSG